ncbi:MAG: SHOCT domain-containing protein [Caldimicrobium sp.]
MRKDFKRATVRPSPLASIATIIVLIFFLVAIASSDHKDDPFIVIFIVIFIVGGIIYSIINLLTYSKKDKKKIHSTATEVIEFESVEQDEKDLERRLFDFETRLRKLESLKKDGLITEEEYQRKRKEIMDEKW